VLLYKRGAGTITSGNVMRYRFGVGSAYTEAPDVIGVNILGFKLPELDHTSMFVSRIIRAEHRSKIPFLADKYSDYYIELPKMTDWSKKTLPPEYHDIWDLCWMYKTKIKDLKEAIRV